MHVLCDVFNQHGEKYTKCTNLPRHTSLRSFVIKWHVLSAKKDKSAMFRTPAENRSAGKFLAEINYRKPRGEESEMIGRNMQPAPRMPRAISAEITFARLSYRYGRIFPFFSSCKERWEKFQQMAEKLCPQTCIGSVRWPRYKTFVRVPWHRMRVDLAS